MISMEFFDAVKNRYSYRGTFLDTPIPREHLEMILDAGIRAPSGCNTQTTSFVAVADPAKRAELAKIVDRPYMQSAQAVILVISDYVEPYPGANFELEDYAAATQNLLLAITALGYASVWVDGHLKHDGRAEAIAKLLGMEKPGRTVRAALPIGVPAEAGGVQNSRLPFEQRAKIL